MDSTLINPFKYCYFLICISGIPLFHGFSSSMNQELYQISTGTFQVLDQLTEIQDHENYLLPSQNAKLSHFYLNLGYSLKGNLGIIRYGLTSNLEIKFSHKRYLPTHQNKNKEKNIYQIEGSENDLKRMFHLTLQVLGMGKNLSKDHIKIKNQIRSILQMAGSIPRIKLGGYTLSHLYTDIVFSSNGKIAQSLKVSTAKQIRYKIKLTNSIPDNQEKINLPLALFKNLSQECQKGNKILNKYKINQFMLGVSRSKSIPLIFGHLKSSINSSLVFTLNPNSNISSDVINSEFQHIDENYYYYATDSFDETQNYSLISKSVKKLKKFPHKKIIKQFSKQIKKLIEIKSSLTSDKAKKWILAQVRLKIDLNGKGDLHLVNMRGRPMFEIELSKTL